MDTDARVRQRARWLLWAIMWAGLLFFAALAAALLLTGNWLGGLSYSGCAAGYAAILYLEHRK